MKKSLALLLVLLLAVSLFSGCSSDELAFLQMNQEVSSLDTYSMTGTLNWDADLDALASVLAKDDLERKAALEFAQIVKKEGLKSLSFAYGINIPAESMSVQYSAGGHQLFDMVLIKDTGYVNFDGLLALIQRNDSDSLQDTALFSNLQSIKGKYLSFSEADFQTAGTASSPALSSFKYQDSIIKQQALRKNMQTYLMDFIKTEMSGYNPGLVKKTYDASLKADVYGYSVKTEELPLLTLDFLKVILDHLDGAETFATRVVNDPVFLAEAGVDADMLKTTVKTSFADIRANLSDTRKTLDETIQSERSTGELSKMIKSTIGSATMECRVAKTAPQKYWNQVKVSLTESPASFPVKNAWMDIAVTVDASAAPVIQKPVSAVSFMEFNDRLPHTLVIEPDYDSASYDAGLLGSEYRDTVMINKNGHWFVSIDSLPQHFRSLVKVNEKTVTVGSHVLQTPDELHPWGGTYIAVSAFKNANVTVTWDDSERTITLEH